MWSHDINSVATIRFTTSLRREQSHWLRDNNQTIFELLVIVCYTHTVIVFFYKFRSHTNVYIYHRWNRHSWFKIAGALYTDFRSLNFFFISVFTICSAFFMCNFCSDWRFYFVRVMRAPIELREKNEKEQKMLLIAKWNCYLKCFSHR